jgi:glycosyltransferase involved in cell wall biosynthesis
MKLFVNGRFLTQRISGVQQFAHEICKELMHFSEITILVPANSPLIDHDFNSVILPIGRFKGHIWEQIDLALFMKKNKDAILLNLCNTAPLALSKQMITLHDLAFAMNPKWFHPVFSLAYNFMVPKLVKKCWHIYTVSETVKLELEQHYAIYPEKICVLGNKVSNDLLLANEKEVVLNGLHNGRYFLMVGSRNLRKNFAFVEDLFLNHTTDQTLVIVGGAHSSFETTTRQKAPNIIYLDYVSLGELKWLYKNAVALINPSLYEGFGIPNIEAMAFGTPVFCSNISVFKEICQEAAFYFALNDLNSLKELVLQSKKKLIGLNQKQMAGKELFYHYQNMNRAFLIFSKF